MSVPSAARECERVSTCLVSNKEQARKAASFCLPLIDASFFLVFLQEKKGHQRDGKQKTQRVKVVGSSYSFDPPCLGMFGLFDPMRRHLVLEVRLEAVFEIGVHRRCQRMEWQELGNPTAKLYQGMFKGMMGCWGGISVNETIQDRGNTKYELMVLHGRGQERASFSAANASIRSNLNLFCREVGQWC